MYLLILDYAYCILKIIFDFLAKINVQLLGFILIFLNFINLLILYSRQPSQLINIETVGLPAITQAEILIVFGLLGLVAESTIPNFYNQYQEQVTVIQLQKSYAVHTNVVNTEIGENGSPDGWGVANFDKKTTLADLNSTITSQFKILKNCNTGAGCFPDVKYKNLKGFYNDTSINTDSQYTKFRLQDGTSIGINLMSPDCNIEWSKSAKLQNVCGLYVIDLNGDKNPNTYGRDFFGFALTKTGLVPLGTPDQSVGYPFSGFCSTNSNANFKYENGLSCTAWVLYNQNMDYLECKGLNWNNGKTSCHA